MHVEYQWVLCLFSTTSWFFVAVLNQTDYHSILSKFQIQGLEEHPKHMKDPLMSQKCQVPVDAALPENLESYCVVVDAIVFWSRFDAVEKPLRQLVTIWTTRCSKCGKSYGIPQRMDSFSTFFSTLGSCCKVCCNGTHWNRGDLKIPGGS